MILSLGQGEPSYIPDGLIGQARGSADITYLAFLQFYGRDLSQWRLICFFACHQDQWCTLDDLAAEMYRELNGLEERLNSMVERGLVEERVLFTGPEYRLTRSPELRRLALRLSAEWRSVATQSE